MTAQPKLKAPTIKIPKIAGLAAAAVQITERIPAPEYILGLDMSLEHTGWSLYTVETKEFTGGVLEPNPNKSKKVVQLGGMRRIAWLRDRVLSLAKYGVVNGKDCDEGDRIATVVFLEGYSYGSKGSSGISLGELGGVIRLGLADEGIAYVEISPMTAKKFVTGSGASDKAQMLKEVYKRWGPTADFNDDNACDAYCLVQIGRALTNTYDDALLAHQKAIVSDLMKAWLKEYPAS